MLETAILALPMVTDNASPELLMVIKENVFGAAKFPRKHRPRLCLRLIFLLTMTCCCHSLRGGMTTLTGKKRQVTATIECSNADSVGRVPSVRQERPMWRKANS